MLEHNIMQWCGDPSYKSPRHVDISIDNIKNSLGGLKADWFRDSTFYHVWLKGFCDSNSDGVGDIAGVVSRLDYIKNQVGCDAIWLSPVFDCGYKGCGDDCNMHGYDTTDYYSVNPLFGTEDELDVLLSEAHRRGIKVIFDFVPNHTSVTHPWFLDFCRGVNGKQDWYLRNSCPLEGWVPMGQNSRTWHSPAKLASFFHAHSMRLEPQDEDALKILGSCGDFCYYGAFGAFMPDLNYRNLEVREEMKNVVRYWLNRGFDGVRVDAVRYLMEDAFASGADTVDTLDTHRFYTELRQDVLDKYAELGFPKCMIAEANMHGDRTLLESYFGTQSAPEFNVLFDFDFASQVHSMVTGFNSHAPFFSFLKETGRKDLSGGAVAGDSDFVCAKAVFLSNHDNPADRPASTYSPAQLRLATAVSLLLPSIPFVYYGNELAQKNVAGYQAMHDIRLRGALDWSCCESHVAQHDSLLNLHREVLSFRAEHPAVRRGEVRLLFASHRAVAAYALCHGDDVVVCVFNVADESLRDVTLFSPAGDLPFSSVRNVPVCHAGKNYSQSGFELAVCKQDNGSACLKMPELPAMDFLLFVGGLEK